MPAMRFVLGIAAIPLMAIPLAQAQTKATCPVVACATSRVATVSSGMHQPEPAKLTVTDAIAVAEQHASGKIVWASLLQQGKKVSYTVVALPNSVEVWRGSVDANSGALIDEHVALLRDAMETDQVGPSKAELAERARLPLRQAVKRAEDQSGGRVFDASLESANRRPVYQIQVVRGDV